MDSIVRMLFWGILKGSLIAFGTIYGVLVLLAYRAVGPEFQFKFDPQDPRRSVLDFLIWLGVKVMAATVRVSRSVYDLLTEASAEVGEWYLRRHGAKIPSEFLSRFQ